MNTFFINRFTLTFPLQNAVFKDIMKLRVQRNSKWTKKTSVSPYKQFFLLNQDIITKMNKQNITPEIEIFSIFKIWEYIGWAC